MGIFFDQAPGFAVLVPLALALLAALGFEFVNGFHDTSNAVATVIYTRAMRPGLAVAYSALLNFLGVMVAGVGVAYSVVNLFPPEAMQPAQHAVALSMVFAVLVASIFWNLGTWVLGIPSSSSHTMIGAIVGASMGYSMHVGLSMEQGVPWDKVRAVMAALLLSPVLGFFCAAALLAVMKLVLRDRVFYAEPDPEKSPPGWIRALLVATCGGVSFSHGSNDGQKGMGLFMLILMALVPASFSLNLATTPAQNASLALRCQQTAAQLSTHRLSWTREQTTRVLEGFVRDQIDATTLAPALAEALQSTSARLRVPLLALAPEQRPAFRALCLLEARCLRKLSNGAQPALDGCADALQNSMEYVTTWVKLAVALALGLGTMIGWKRIVVTIGEKIGKTHLSYAQGVAAQTVATLTILLADRFHLPVSTTHVLSSGVAGSMCAQRSGLQSRTVAMIATAWVLTLPVCITLGMGLFLVFLGIFQP